MNSKAGWADPNIKFHHGYWQLAPDEALLIYPQPPPTMDWTHGLVVDTLSFLFQLRIRVSVKHEPVIAHLHPVCPTDTGISNSTTGGWSLSTMSVVIKSQ